MSVITPQPDVPLLVEFEQQLSGLVRNDAKIIHALTALAARAKSDSEVHVITASIARLIIMSDTDRKMPGFYLMDSVMKNASPAYAKAFACFVAQLFSAVFTLVSSPDVKSQMWRLYDIWIARGAFEPLVLESMQQKLNSIGNTSGTCWLEVPDLLERMCHKLSFVRYSHVVQCANGEQNVIGLLRLLAQLDNTLNKSDDEGLLSVIQEYEQKKERPLKALKALYSDTPHRCNRCGMRYETREALTDHLDAHYFETMAGRTKHGVRVQRNWFVSASNWIATNGGLASAPKQRTASAARNSSSKEADTGNNTPINAYFLTIDASNESLATKCGACGDDIDGAVYQEDGNWAYPNTVQSEGDDAALYHVECAKWLIVPNKKRQRVVEEE